MSVQLAIHNTVYPQPTKTVPLKDMIIDSKEIRAILALGTRGDVRLPDQKHQVDILI